MSTSSIPQEFNDMFDFDNLDVKGQAMFSPDQFAASSFATVNDPLSGQPQGTVSPKDLMGDSAPPSTSFTDLSTPSFESPGYFSPADTSPLFGTDAELAPGHETWDSLFPVNDGYSNSHLDEPSLLTTTKLSKDLAPPSPMIRNGSSPGQSPSVSRGSGSGRQSSVSGVNGRRREKPLKPLSYDTTDPVAVKRARNTEAARKSRARKVERQDHMERRIQELEKSLEEAMEREAYWKALAETK